MSVGHLPTGRRPTPPGRFIQSDILEEYGLTQEQLARLLKVSRLTVNELVRERRSLTAGMAVRLARLTNQSPQFWLNLQNAVDLWDAEFGDGSEVLREIEALPCLADEP